MEQTPFNPLDKRSLAVSVVDALLEQPVVPLPPAERLDGAGIYAIYYTGDFHCYSLIKSANAEGRFALPIYVGKAVPKGARKGGYGLGAAPGAVLHNRLCEHAESIVQATNLHLSDFACRYLVVDDIWIPLGESMLIESFSPAWNRWLDGFGNHDPGAGRHNQRKPPWDVLHPGRPWADRLRDSGNTPGSLSDFIIAQLAKA